MEHIITSQIHQHLERHGILHRNQYGFRKGLSYEMQLISTIQDWASNTNKKNQTDVVLLDFSKAFDKVSHRKLLHKIDFYGVRGKNQSMDIWIPGPSSAARPGQWKSLSSTDVLSGIPQGKVLGPLLFLLYINDIATNIQSPMHLFMDDSLVYMDITSPADHAALQNDINTLHDWAITWQMDLSVPSCH